MCVQPCMLYYAWQVEVMLNNFVLLGLDEHYDIHILGAYNNSDPNLEQNLGYFRKLQAEFADAAFFYFYEDTRPQPVRYISSIRPHLLKKHFEQFPYMINRNVFYHDCDIMFTKFPHFLNNLLDDDKWYVSDTISYIGHDYILSKGQDVLDKMCEIVGIDQQLVKSKQLQSGGAQYLMKGVDAAFFEEMERNCETLFYEITNLNNEKKRQDPSHHELQIWCADMWCLLWGAWKRDHDTIIIPELEFCWATENKDKWNKNYIFHNAGVTPDMANRLFYKYNYRDTLPYSLDGLSFDINSASHNYFTFLKRVGNNTCLL